MTAIAVASLVAVPTVTASAVSTGRPTAVAVAADGTSYVGFADADGLLVLAPDGTPKGSLALAGVGPVTGLAVDPGGSIWVDDGSTVARFSPSGVGLGSFPHRPAASCSADAGRYGGLDVTSSRVYVAERCRTSVGVYTRTGALLPGTPRGIAFAPAFTYGRAKKVPARLYVSVPDAGKVYGYNAGGIGSRSKPVATLTRTRPGGVSADDRGHVAVLDSATHGLYLYDATKRYRLYRTLGHPPTAAATKGYLKRPAAVAQGGAPVGRHYWLADTGNGRVQRWNPAGTTQWMADTQPSSAPGTPTSTGVPVIGGNPVPGAELTCTDGSWTGGPTSYAHAWLRDGEPIGGAAASSYVVAAEDVGTELSCVVTATNAAGESAPAGSVPVVVDDGLPDPEPVPVTTCRGEPWVRIEPATRIVSRPFVTLEIQAPEGAEQVEISNDGFKSSDVKPLAAGCRYEWTLDDGPGRKPKLVSVRFPGAPGVVQDQVLLDGAAPVIHRVSAKWITARQGWVLKIRATDRGTGISKVLVGKLRSSARSYKWPADIVSWDSTQLRWIRVVDGAGYRSKWYRLRL
ncbi:hypothetical protein GCM10023350_26230 [Nocardioides endophyticus]|uniref:Ig-like domain-containing protein n=1 Tax=Nocardioides endophyticus TaxID=1353775 RepID=A0ABP8YXP0_9ACTN